MSRNDEDAPKFVFRPRIKPPYFKEQLVNTRQDPKHPQLTVKVADAVHDGLGQYLPVGAKIVVADAEAARSLKAKGFAA